MRIPITLRMLAGPLLACLLSANCGGSSSAPPASALVLMAPDKSTHFATLTSAMNGGIIAAGTYVPASSDRSYLQAARFRGTTRVLAFGSEGSVEVAHPTRPWLIGVDAIVDSAQRIVICGTSYTTQDNAIVEARGVVVRLLSSGNLDLEFGDEGIAEFPASLGPVTGCFAVRELAGAYLVLGINQPPVVIADGGVDAAPLRPLTAHSFVVQFNGEGDFDPEFAQDGVLAIPGGDASFAWLEVEAEAGGHIYTVHHENTDPSTSAVDMFLSRYSAEGELDPAFGNGRVLVSKGSDQSYDRSMSGFCVLDKALLIGADRITPDGASSQVSPVIWTVTEDGVASNHAVSSDGGESLASYTMPAISCGPDGIAGLTSHVFGEEPSFVARYPGGRVQSAAVLESVTINARDVLIDRYPFVAGSLAINTGAGMDSASALERVGF